MKSEAGAAEVTILGAVRVAAEVVAVSTGLPVEDASAPVPPAAGVFDAVTALFVKVMPWVSVARETVTPTNPLSMEAL